MSEQINNEILRKHYGLVPALLHDSIVAKRDSEIKEMRGLLELSARIMEHLGAWNNPANNAENKIRDYLQGEDNNE